MKLLEYYHYTTIKYFLKKSGGRICDLSCIFDEELNVGFHFSITRTVFAKRVCSLSRIHCALSRNASAIALSSSESLRYVPRRRGTNKQHLLWENKTSRRKMENGIQFIVENTWRIACIFSTQIFFGCCVQIVL